MPKVLSITYQLDSGSHVDYRPINPENVDEETLSAIIKLIDGAEVEDICSGLH